MAARNFEDGNSRKRRGPLTEIPIKYQAASVGIIPEVPGHENLPPVQSAAYSRHAHLHAKDLLSANLSSNDIATHGRWERSKEL